MSLGREGLTIEIGPVPQGVLLHDACLWMEAAVVAVMDFVEAFNTNNLSSLPKRAVVYRDFSAKVPVPVGSDGKPVAIFHKDFQGSDFRPLRKGDPLFVDLDGSVIAYDGSFGDEVWPIFVNEAAYYFPESGLGFGVTVREEIDVPHVTVSTL